MIDKILTGFFFIASIFLLVSHADAAEVGAKPLAQELVMVQSERLVK